MGERAGQRADAALALKLSGATWEEVAQATKYADGERARIAVEAMLARSAKNADRGQAREMARNRYERLLRGVWMKAIDPANPEHLPAIRAARELVDRMVVLDGAAMPTEVIVHNPTQAELEAFLARITGTTLTDIVEAEVIDYPELPSGEQSA